MNCTLTCQGFIQEFLLEVRNFFKITNQHALHPHKVCTAIVALILNLVGFDSFHVQYLCSNHVHHMLITVVFVNEGAVRY